VAIIQSMCDSFKLGLLTGVHDFSTHIFKTALYTGAAELSATTTAYTTSGEVVGAGYSAGGATLTATAPSVSNGVALVDFSDATWPSATFTARGALIYNSSVAGNPAVAVLDFGADKTVLGRPFTVSFPNATSETAIVRIA
jgi:hypothetical protein